MGFFDRLPEQQEQQEGTSVEREIKRARAFGWRDVVICLLIVGFFLLSKDFLSSRLGFAVGDSYGGLRPVLEEKQFGITGLDGVTHTFVYVDSEMELHDDLSDYLANEKGELIEGSENKRVYSGTYRNDAFGEYQLHVQIKLHDYIVVRNADGVIVFNLESDETTKELHRYLNELRDEQLASPSDG